MTSEVAAGSDLVIGEDGWARCAWAGSTAQYVRYHDQEWGRPRRDGQALFEKLSLEVFQCGLSWLTVLRKREAFRRAFAGFDVSVLARFGQDDVVRLLADSGIVRNRAKIEAVIVNARATLRLPVPLPELLWSFAPAPRARWTALSQVPSVTAESAALARELRRRGFSYVGPTTAYALMQATGMVNDHLAGCFVARDVGRLP